MSEAAGPEFDLYVTDAGDEVVVTVCGELDVATAPLLQAAIADARARGRPVVLDTADVVFMDSTGLAGLLAARTAGGDGSRPVLRRPSRAVLRVLELTGIASVFRIDEG